MSCGVSGVGVSACVALPNKAKPLIGKLELSCTLIGLPVAVAVGIWSNSSLYFSNVTCYF